MSLQQVSPEQWLSRFVSPDVARRVVEYARRRGLPAHFVAPRAPTVTEKVWSRYFSLLRQALNEVLDQLRRLPTPEARRRWLLENMSFGETSKVSGERSKKQSQQQQSEQKQQQEIPVWRLPAMVTCPGASGLCRVACYALKGNYIKNPALHRGMVINLLASLLPEFPQAFAQLIKRSGAKIVRLHDSGDFYSTSHVLNWLQRLGIDIDELSRLLGIDLRKLPEDWYVRAVTEAAKMVPDVQIYTYTRSWRNTELIPALKNFTQQSNTALYLSTDLSMPSHEVKNAENLADQLGAKLAYTGMAPTRPAVICPAEKTKLEGGRRTISCTQCMICPLARANVVFPIH